jgi:hypothetical protein
MNFGQRPFAYTAPSGFKALCTQNLPTPTIGATTATQAGKFFNTVLYTGDGANPRSITGVGFQPDWVWGKRRSFTGDHFLMDSVRGTQRSLSSNTTAVEDVSSPNGLVQSFDSDGATFQGSSTNNNLNNSAITYVAWNWKANGSGSTNTSGSITSTVSANTTSGFSIVTYTGNGTSGSTVGHSLAATPAMIFIKARSAGLYNWRVYHSSLTAGYNLFLNTTSAQTQMSTDSVGYISGVSVSTFTLTAGTSNSDAVNGSGVTYVAYCFAPIAGYSAFGSYTGNSSTDGTFVYLGFRPAYMMIKASNAIEDWVIMDVARNPYNAVNFWLNAEDTSAEATLSPPQFDFNSNGMKLRGTSSTINATGTTYIYMAFASNPFKTSLAR